MQADTIDTSRQARSWRRCAAQLGGAAGCLALIAFVAYRLFDGITIVGIDGVDTFTYLDDTLALLHPNADAARLLPPGESVHRIATFALDLFALKLLGVNDYAIRAVVGAAQLLSIGLVYLLGLRVSRNPLLALAAAILYGLNRWTLVYARTELPHVYAVLFVLLATHCALSAIGEGAGRRLRAVATAGAGFFAADAAAAHEDLILFALGLALTAAAMIVAAARGRGRRAPVAWLAGLFAVGFAAGIAWPMLATGIGPRRLAADLLSFQAGMDANTAARTGHSLASFLALVPRRVFGELGFNLIGFPLVVLTAAVILAAPFRRLAGSDRRRRGVLFLAAISLFYLVTFVFVVRVYLEGDYARILLPLLGPMLVLTLAGGAELAAAALRPLAGGAAAAPLAVAVCLGLALPTLSPSGLPAPSLAPSVHRQLYDAANTLASDDRRLMLPACYGVYRNWVGVGSPIYLGDRAVPVFAADDLRPFDRFVAGNRIRYVVVMSFRAYRPMTPSADLAKLFATLYGAALPSAVEQTLQPVASVRRPSAWWLSPEAETIWPGDTRVWWSGEVCDFESALLTRLLADRGAKIVARLANVGDIYELP